MVGVMTAGKALSRSAAYLNREHADGIERATPHGNFDPCVLPNRPRAGEADAYSRTDSKGRVGEAVVTGAAAAPRYRSREPFSVEGRQLPEVPARRAALHEMPVAPRPHLSRWRRAGKACVAGVERSPI
jgi:hypothetical protein